MNGDEEVFLLCDKVQKGLWKLVQFAICINILFHSIYAADVLLIQAFAGKLCDCMCL